MTFTQEQLPPFPDRVTREGGYHVYKGVRYTVYDDGNSACVPELEDTVAALRARLAQAVDELTTCCAYISLRIADEPGVNPQGWMVLEDARATIAAIREPSP